MGVPVTAPEEASAWPPVSVVMPIREEARHLRDAVTRVLAQDYPGPLEVVLAIGPSRDGTQAVAELLAAEDERVQWVPNPSGATPAALNAALAAARHGIVARVDGHALLPDDYLRTAVATLQETGADNVGGVMAAEGETAFEHAVARAMTSWFGVGGARFHTGGEAGPADTVYLGVFRRAALDRVGGYDETFLRAQDWELNYRIRNTGGLVWFTPRMQVSYRPRRTVRALAEQYFHYGRWRRQVMRQYPDTVNARYLAPPVAVAGIVVGTVAGLAGVAADVTALRLGFVVPVSYAAAVLGASAVTGRGLPAAARVRLPLVYATMHLAWGCGFLSSPRRLAPTAPRVAAGAPR